MVEFALLSTLAMFVLLVAIQLAVIGQAALAVSQLAYQGARYASVNPTAGQSSIVAHLQSIAPSNINNAKNLTIVVSPAAAPRSFSSTVSVTVTYQLGNSLALSNPFLGLKFPTSLTVTHSAMSE